MTEIASHRGGAFLWPENSASAFRHALALPAEQLELDVHLTADDEAVVMHDATLDRTTDCTGRVRAWTAEALRAVRVKGAGGEGVPTLGEAASMVRDAGRVLRLEIKADEEGRPYPGAVARCAAILDAIGMRQSTVLMSFQPVIVMDAAAAGGFAGRVLLLEAPTWRGMGEACAMALCRACGADEVGLSVAEWSADGVAALRANGLRVSAWGANHPATIRRALRLGLDALATDDPPLALRMRAELAETTGAATSG